MPKHRPFVFAVSLLGSFGDLRNVRAQTGLVTARCHLACEITEDGDQLEVVWLFRSQLFEQARVENLGRLFESVLAGACRTPEVRVAALTESSR